MVIANPLATNIGVRIPSKNVPSAIRSLEKSFRVSQYPQTQVPAASNSAGSRTAGIVFPITEQLARMMYAINGPLL